MQGITKEYKPKVDEYKPYLEGAYDSRVTISQLCELIKFDRKWKIRPENLIEREEEAYCAELT